MADEVVVCKGVVIGVNAHQSYISGKSEISVDRAKSAILLFGNINTDVSFSPHSYDQPDTPTQLYVDGALEFGSEYEFIMRKVVKAPPKAKSAEGPRMFKDGE
jgi:hypothetical protein